MIYHPQLIFILGITEGIKTTNLVINDVDASPGSASGLSSREDDAKGFISTLQTGTPLEGRSEMGDKSMIEEISEEHVELTVDNDSQRSRLEIKPTSEVNQRSESIHNTGITGNSSQRDEETDYYKVHENRILVKEYLHNLLVYINRNDATLATDKDGDLAFFTNKMPPDELTLTFSEWLVKKMAIVEREFVQESEFKLKSYRDRFQKMKDSIMSIDNDKTLIEMAERLGAL